MRVIKYLYILPDFIDNCFFHLFCMGTWETYRRSLKNARRQGNHFCSPINQHLSPGNSSFTGTSTAGNNTHNIGWPHVFKGQFTT